MPPDMKLYFENRREYLENRASFPPQELRKYAGKWIVWSVDGSHVAASADSLKESWRTLMCLRPVLIIASGWRVLGVKNQRLADQPARPVLAPLVAGRERRHNSVGGVQRKPSETWSAGLPMH